MASGCGPQLFLPSCRASGLGFQERTNGDRGEMKTPISEPKRSQARRQMARQRFWAAITLRLSFCSGVLPLTQPCLHLGDWDQGWEAGPGLGLRGAMGALELGPLWPSPRIPWPRPPKQERWPGCCPPQESGQQKPLLSLHLPCESSGRPWGPQVSQRPPMMSPLRESTKSGCSEQTQGSAGSSGGSPRAQASGGPPLPWSILTQVGLRGPGLWDWSAAGCAQLDALSELTDLWRSLLDVPVGCLGVVEESLMSA